MKVIAFDTDERTVEMQLFENGFDEYEFDNWYLLCIDAIAPPEY